MSKIDYQSVINFNCFVENLEKLPDVLFTNFADTIEGKWIVHFSDHKFQLTRINPYVAYDLLTVEQTNWFRQVNEPYYPCLKYRISADKNIDGTDQLVIAESVPESGLIFALRDS